MVAIPPSLPNLPNLCFGPFELNPASSELRKSGILIKLQPQPFRLLLLLAERSGTVVTREEIQRCLWTESTFVDFDHGINFSINQIRSALADNAEKPRFVETLPRRGYRFIASVRVNSNGHNRVGIADPLAAPAIPANSELTTARDSHVHSVVYIRPNLEPSKIETKPGPHTKLMQMMVATGVGLFMAAATLWIMTRRPAPGSPPQAWKLRQLTTNLTENPVTNGAISPDGKYLAYTDTNGMHLKLTETGETSLIPRPASLNGKDVEWRIVQQWFPDSTRFLADAHPAGRSPAFLSSQGSSIWIVAVLGGPPRKLRDDAIASSISPDGSSIAFATGKGRLGDREIWLMGPNGEDARKLFETDENGSINAFRWFPNGRRVAYGANHFAVGGLVSRDLDGGPVTHVFPPSESNKVWEYTLSPDSRVLYPLGETGAAGQTCNYWAMHLDLETGVASGSPRRLTNWAGFCPLDTSVTADGRKLAFLKWMGRSSISMADFETDPVRFSNSRLFAPSEGQDYPLDWTADSKNIFYSSNRNGHSAIYLQPLDGDSPEPLVIGSYDGVDARVSPDGSWLIYSIDTDEGAKGALHVMRIPVTGGTSQLVLTARPYSEFRCAKSPAALCVLAERTDDRTQFVFTAFDPISGRGAELARIDIHSEAKKLHWDLSPDGSRLAFTKTPDDPIEILSLLTNSTHTLPVRGWGNLDSLDWTAKGDGFFIYSGVHGGMVLLHVDLRGNAVVLQRNLGDAAAFARPSPDGRHLAIQDYRIQGNIWTLENF